MGIIREPIEKVYGNLRRCHKLNYYASFIKYYFFVISVTSQ